MPLAKELPVLRRELQEQLTQDLPAALNALKALLPETSEKYRIVVTLLARLNDANKERYRNTISPEEYQRRCDQVRADFFDLVATLEEPDFDPQAAEAKSDDKPAVKTGSVLYRIPNVMPLNKETRCTVRIAINEEALLENIMLDDQVQVKSQIEVSDVMSAELIDPNKGSTFQITALNAHTQLVRDSGYTEWLFSVTPLQEGVHQLLVKVSIMEAVPGFTEPVPREVSLFETITILTEAEAPEEGREAPMKAAGLMLSFAGGKEPKAASANASAPVAVPGTVLAQAGKKLLAFFAVAVIATVAGIFLIPKIRNSAPPTPTPPPIEMPPTSSSPDTGKEKQTTSATTTPEGDALPPGTGKEPLQLLEVNVNPPKAPANANPAIHPGGETASGGKDNPAQLGVNPDPLKPENPDIKVQLSRRSGFTMIQVAGGAFNMGQSYPDYDGKGNSRDECLHSETVQSFQIGQYEVTCADWREIMGVNPPSYNGCDDCPAGSISWHDAKEFIRKANAQRNEHYRLPREKEWEYAAKGGQMSKNYKYAGGDDADEVAWFVINSKGSPHPVGNRKPNELQLCDMSGNMYEWCEDTYVAYSPECEGQYNESRRILRGGSWFDVAQHARVANRVNGNPSSRVHDFGFRLARD